MSDEVYEIVKLERVYWNDYSGVRLFINRIIINSMTIGM